MNVWKKVLAGLLVACLVVCATGCADLLEAESSQEASVSDLVDEQTESLASTSTANRSEETTTTTKKDTTTTTTQTTTTTTRTTTTTTRMTTTRATQAEVMVWIPTNGGKKYHSQSSCSKMIDPDYVSLAEAERLGFTPCGRCY